MKAQHLGTLGERLAQKYFDTNKYNVLKKNYRSRFGEIDIIAEHNGVTIFCEVKTRHGRFFGIGEESITHAKLQKIKKTAWLYMEQYSVKKWRIDAIIIELRNSRWYLKHYTNINR